MLCMHCNALLPMHWGSHGSMAPGTLPSAGLGNATTMHAPNMTRYCFMLVSSGALPAAAQACAPRLAQTPQTLNLPQAMACNATTMHTLLFMTVVSRVLSYAGCFRMLVSTHALPAHARVSWPTAHADPWSAQTHNRPTTLNSPQAMARGLYCMKTWVVPLSSSMPWGSAHWQHRAFCDTTHPLAWPLQDQRLAHLHAYMPIVVRCSRYAALNCTLRGAQRECAVTCVQMQLIPACPYMPTHNAQTGH